MKIGLFAFIAISALAQNAPSGSGSVSGFRFEVVSIKPVSRGPGVQLGVGNPTPNGFTATAGMWQWLEFAFGPSAPALRTELWQDTEMKNEPGWVHQDLYSIDARVSQNDLKAWQSQTRNQDLLHSALRAALKERFKLALHEEPAKRTIIELVVSKRGPRLKPATPAASLPTGLPLESGGVRALGGKPTDMDMRGATMQDLADALHYIFFDGPVRDRTGLTGRYDFYVPRIETPGEDRGFSYSVADLGLEFRRGTENRPILVIDHIEKPTPN